MKQYKWMVTHYTNGNKMTTIASSARAIVKRYLGDRKFSVERVRRDKEGDVIECDVYLGADPKTRTKRMHIKREGGPIDVQGAISKKVDGVNLRIGRWFNSRK